MAVAGSGEFVGGGASVAEGAGVSVTVTVSVIVAVSVDVGIGVKLGVGELGVNPIGVRVGVFVLVGETSTKVLVGGASVISWSTEVLVGMGVCREGARWMATIPAQ